MDLLDLLLAVRPVDEHEAQRAARLVRGLDELPPVPHHQLPVEPVREKLHRVDHDARGAALPEGVLDDADDVLEVVDVRDPVPLVRREEELGRGRVHEDEVVRGERSERAELPPRELRCPIEVHVQTRLPRLEPRDDEVTVAIVPEHG